MRQRIAEALRALAVRVDPTVYVTRPSGPILQEDVDDLYGGVVPDGRWVFHTQYRGETSCNVDHGGAPCPGFSA